MKLQQKQREGIAEARSGRRSVVSLASWLRDMSGIWALHDEREFRAEMRRAAFGALVRQAFCVQRLHCSPTTQASGRQVAAQPRCYSYLVTNSGLMLALCRWALSPASPANSQTPSLAKLAR